ncbi:hypothetical protein Tco_0414104 [Tanacetum coccineum]
MSKEVGTPRYLSLVVPLKKVGDEAVHKELGDRMERAATTASSLEAEQDSGSGPRCQDTILGDVDAQTQFETTSKQSNDPPLSRGYTLGSREDSMELLEFMEFYTQLSYKNRKSVLFLLLVYFNAAKLMLIPLGSVNAVRHMLMLPVFIHTVNGVRQLQALVDKKKVIITESNIRSDLHLDVAEGTDCLPTATIFEELGKHGVYEIALQIVTFNKAFFSPQYKYFIHTITQCLSAKSTAWNEFNSIMDSLIICLATNQKFNLSKYIFDAMVKHLDGGVKFLMYLCFLQVFINQQLGDMSHHKKIFVNPFHTNKVFANMKRAGKDFFRRITPLFDTIIVQVSKEVGKDLDHLIDSNQIPIVDQLSTSSQPKQKQKSKRRQRKEAEVPQDETEHEESVSTPSNDPQPSGEDSMQLNDLMVLCTKLQAQVLDLEKAKDAQAKEIAALKKRVQRLEIKKKSRTTGLQRLKKVGMSRRVESSEDQKSLGDHKDASKQGRSIEDIDADVEASSPLSGRLGCRHQEKKKVVVFVLEFRGKEAAVIGFHRQNEDLMFDTGVLDSDEMLVEAKIDEKNEQSTKLDDSTASEAVTTAGVDDSAAPTIPTTEEQVSVSKPIVYVTQPSVKDKGKGIMIEPKVPLKRKDQVALDEQMARDVQAQLEAELIEEEKLARKQEE